jgi:tRNA G18 (ribose-2'-O)-methylase SpoU
MIRRRHPGCLLVGMPSALLPDRASAKARAVALFPPIDLPADEVKAALAPIRNDFSVAIYNSHNAFSVGAIIRVAHNFLAREIVVIGDAPFYEKASMAMDKYETIVRHSTDEEFLAWCTGRPLWSVEKDFARTSVYDVKAFPKDVVLLFGSERTGIPQTLLSRSDEVVGIPIYGVNHSLPVSVAAGITMHEWARRHYAGTVR